jgi:predicted TIM-barrel fold metal-dependent hydrolase
MGEFLIVDTDVHPMTRRGWPDIVPYVAKSSRERLEVALTSRDLGPARSPSPIADMSKGANFAADTYAPDGSRPGSDPEFTREQLLDGHGVGCAILTPFEPLYSAALGNADVGVELARAYNDYFVDQWLPVDSRFRLAVCVSPRDPDAAAKEVRRLADLPGVVGVVLPYEKLLLGHPYYFPIYEAAEEAGLPILTHTGQGTYMGNPARTAGGNASNYFQNHTLMCQIAMAQVVSIVGDGVLQRFPALKFVFLEYGFSWMLHLMWRFDAEWRSLHADAPWLVEPPSHYIRQSIRCSTQPIDQPERKGDLAEMIDMIHGDEILVFSSDYPHWDNEFPDNALNGLSTEMKERIFYKTALETFPKISVPEPAPVG